MDAQVSLGKWEVKSFETARKEEEKGKNTQVRNDESPVASCHSAQSNNPCGLFCLLKTWVRGRPLSLKFRKANDGFRTFEWEGVAPIPDLLIKNVEHLMCLAI